jgi:Ran GTPase-activating protein (RanGAP) involved in mRNA processing and transport
MTLGKCHYCFGRTFLIFSQLCLVSVLHGSFPDLAKLTFRTTIRDKIIPHAVSWFTGEAVQAEGLDDVDDGDDDDEEEENEDEDEDDEEESKPVKEVGPSITLINFHVI